MAQEIERKFLVKNDAWRRDASGMFYKQGYICGETDRVVRVRRIGDQAYLTVKKLVSQLQRLEFEYEIPLADAEEMLQTCCSGAIIEKTRYKVEFAGNIWEIDAFAGENRGLVVAEIELRSESQKFEKPGWIGKEVSDDARYFNANLVRHPFCKW